MQREQNVIKLLELPPRASSINVEDLGNIFGECAKGGGCAFGYGSYGKNIEERPSDLFNEKSGYYRRRLIFLISSISSICFE
jgi:hypothetical protein